MIGLCQNTPDQNGQRKYKPETQTFSKLHTTAIDLESMTKNKDRVYIILYACGGPGSHWALTHSLKDPSLTDETASYHARNFPLPGGGRGLWEYDRGTMGAISTNNALVRLLVGKLKPSMRDQMEDVLEKVAIIQGDPQ